MSGRCFQTSLHANDDGLIQLSNVNAFDNPVTGSVRPSAVPENTRPAPKRPAPLPSLNENDASGPLLCAGATIMKANSSTTTTNEFEILMPAIVRSIVAPGTPNA